MQIKKNAAKVRKIDNGEIINYLTKDINKSFSLAVVILNGEHSMTLNEISDRAYYIIEGKGIVIVDKITYNVESEDVILIPKNTIHFISGSLKYIVVNSPAFDPSSEKIQLK